MKHKNTITILSLLIVLFATLATTIGIFSQAGTREYEYESIHGQKIIIYGKGIYQYMSSDAAIQGIAQDYITLFLAIPLLLIGIFWSRKNSLRGLFLLSGTLGYFLLTYLFYLAMAMYNALFIVYVLLLGTSFFAFILTLFSYEFEQIKYTLVSEKILRYAGIFLMINSILVSFSWLSVIIPPLLDGSIIPAQVEHYTTLIVQGFDLALFLPMSFICGLLALRQENYGYVFTTIYIIFLSILMTALTSKICFIANAGGNIIPIVFIIPTINIIAIIFSILLLKNMKNISPPPTPLNPLVTGGRKG
jgi:hypothetical protein